MNPPDHHDTRRDQAEKAAAELRELARTRVLADLFDRRPELAGVYPPADLSAEAVLWSA